MYDDNLPPGVTQEDLDKRDEEPVEDDFTDIGDNSDDTLEEQLE
jgi:hypothetical protein